MAKKVVKTNNGKPGGMLDGKLHVDGGIKAVVVSDDGGQRPVELEAEEVIITRPAVADPEVYTYTGTNKQILSAINQGGGGVPIYAAGGAVKSGRAAMKRQVQKKVDEINRLIALAYDSDGDPIGVIDTTSTWEEPYVYKPIKYSNGVLYIESRSDLTSNDDWIKDKILSSNIHWDGMPILNHIAKMYRAALKKKGIAFEDGGIAEAETGTGHEVASSIFGDDIWMNITGS